MANSNGTVHYRLRDLVAPATKTIEIGDGTYRLLKLDWAGWETVERMEAGEARPTEIFAEVKKILPDTPDEVLRSLSIEEAGAILFVAAKSVQAMAANAPPNSGGEAATSETAAPTSPSSA